MVKKINNNSKRLLLFFSIIIIYLLAWPISVDPVSWESPPDTRKDPIFSINQKLSGIKIFREDDGYLGPEDIVLNAKNWAEERLAQAESIGAKDAIYKEFEEWIEVDEDATDLEIMSLEPLEEYYNEED